MISTVFNYNVLETKLLLKSPVQKQKLTIQTDVNNGKEQPKLNTNTIWIVQTCRKPIHLFKLLKTNTFSKNASNFVREKKHKPENVGRNSLERHARPIKSEGCSLHYLSWVQKNFDHGCVRTPPY